MTIDAFARFAAALRAAGIAVSPAEALEALRALEATGIEERGQVRAALACTLCKRAAQRATFDRVFDATFAPPRGAGAARSAGTGRGVPAAAEGRRAAAAAGGRPERAQPARTGRGAVPVAPNVDAPPPRESRAAALVVRLAGLRHGAAGRVGRLRRVLVAPPDRVPPDPHVPADAPDPRRHDLGRGLTLEQERALVDAVPRLVRRIRLRTGRRFVPTRRGRLYLRAVFRRNAALGGVPFVLPRRRRRPRRARLVLLIDVSWSAARAAGLFLCLAGEFLRRARDTRVLFFVDRPIEATSVVERWLRERAGGPAGPGCFAGPGAGIVRGGRSFAALLAGVADLNLQAPSDYGRTFHALARSRTLAAGRKTVLVILGDGRTNRFEPQEWALEAIAASCGAVLWLVPEPAGRWGTEDSRLDVYAPQVDCLVETRDLAGLARGVHELLRHL